MTITKTDWKRNTPLGTTEQDHTLPPAQATTPDRSGDAPEPGLPGVGGADGMGGYGRSFLTASVGRGQENRADDVHTVSTFLAENKLMPAATQDADEDFLSAIEKGQIKLNQLAGDGLRVDGIVKPWGPTEVLSQRAVTSGNLRAPDAKSEPFPWFSGEPPDEGIKQDSDLEKALYKIQRGIFGKPKNPFKNLRPFDSPRG